MYTTTDLQLFIRTADSGNLSKAARALNLQPATASASLKRLEQRLDTRLFERSTRSMRLTQQGEIFLEYCRNALALLGEGEAAIAAERGTIRGHVRLSAPSDLGRNVLLPWINAFQDLHPQVTMSLQFSDQVIDLIRDPVDVAIRYGKLDDSSMTSQHLARNWHVIVASPAYLARQGCPKTPKDLADHNCLLFYLKQGLHNIWRFRAGKNPVDIKVRGDRMADDGGIAREWAVAGLGIAIKSWLDVQADVESGRLVTILDDFISDDYPLSAVYPHRSSTSPAARALVTYLRTQLDARTASTRSASGPGAHRTHRTKKA